MKLLTGQRGVAILYAYMLLGLGFLRSVTPDFGYLTSREQQLEGTFRSFLVWFILPTLFLFFCMAVSIILTCILL